jgi:hypothetical protein
MTSKKKILLITTEDVEDLKSWSNVPYLFYNSLKKTDNDIYPYLIKEFLSIKFIVNKAVSLFNRISKKKSVTGIIHDALFNVRTRVFRLVI